MLSKEGGEIRQTVDITTGFRQSDESFRPPFSKGGAVEGAQPSSRSAEREIFFRRFFLRTFSLRLRCQRKSGEWDLCIVTNCIPLVYNL